MAKTNSEIKAIKKRPIEKEFIDENSSLFDLRTTQGQLLFLFITIAISSLVQMLPSDTIKSSIRLFTHQIDQCKQSLPPTPMMCNNSLPIQKPTYWIFNKKSDNQDHLKHVHLVLKRLGYKYGTNASDWDLLWAHDYPFFSLHPHLQQNLKAHQRVNHFPGCGFITNKVDLATTDIKYIPKAFHLPKQKNEFLNYAQQHPAKMFVQKHNQHRHIYVRSLKDIDFNNSDTFLQEYIDNPFLVDGYKFDMGVYVIITSVDPLRVYIYTGDVLFRYCPQKYYPFDSTNLDKYVVGDDYLPTWEVPSLSTYYDDYGFGMKDSFDAYVRSRGKDPNYIWEQVEDAIRISILSKEGHLATVLNKFNSKRNFFELIRFDLVIDDHLNVYLLEANMSPNLSSAHFKQNTLLYEQVIYNTLNLVGIGSTLERESLKKRSVGAESMISTDKNIVVFAEKCAQSDCTESCDAPECSFCRRCLSSDDMDTLHTAYREHIHKGDTKRIFPVPIVNKESIEKHVQGLSKKNRMMSEWFYGKCLMESSWCS